MAEAFMCDKCGEFMKHQPNRCVTKRQGSMQVEDYGIEISFFHCDEYSNVRSWDKDICESCRSALAKAGYKELFGGGVA